MNARRSPRHPYHARVWCDGEAESLYAPTTNVSAGGVFVRTHHPFRVGDEVRVTFRAHDSATPAILRTRVAWAHHGGQGPPQAGMGLELVEIEQGQAVYDGLIEDASTRAASIRSACILKHGHATHE